jgi:RNA polymerase-binding transcription factor DksA
MKIENLEAAKELMQEREELSNTVEVAEKYLKKGEHVEIRVFPIDSMISRKCHFKNLNANLYAVESLVKQYKSRLKRIDEELEAL